MTCVRVQGVIRCSQESHGQPAKGHWAYTLPHITNKQLRSLELALLACGSPRSSGGARLCEIQSFDLAWLGKVDSDCL